MKKSWFLLLFLFILVGCSRYNKVFKSKDPEYKLRMAEQYFANKKYNVAQQLYEDLFTYFKGDPRYEDMIYKYAYCFYNQNDYLSAENYFKNFLEIFPKSSKAEEVDYMRCYSFYKQSPKPDLDQSNTVKAIGAMQTFIANHPGSARIADANKVIDICRGKLEIKALKASTLYYNLGQYKAAAISFTNLINDYPDSPKGDEYKLMVVRAYYQYAILSVEEKQRERYEQVITEYNDFADRYPDSKLIKDAERYYNLTQNNLKALSK
ncbi:MAG: outer membrane protein assembly factor BamD [Sphingobacteriales bacterium]|nr:outer membrane protein assembly factor BamD [Sphingobacteriales bacterium]